MEAVLGNLAYNATIENVLFRITIKNYDTALIKWGTNQTDDKCGLLAATISGNSIIKNCIIVVTIEGDNAENVATDPNFYFITGDNRAKINDCYVVFNEEVKLVNNTETGSNAGNAVKTAEEMEDEMLYDGWNRGVWVFGDSIPTMREVYA